MSKVTVVEDEHNDFKKIWSDKAFEDMTAFANHRGGVVWVGVDDTGQVVGGEFPDKEIQHIANLIVNLLKIIPSMELQEIDGKRVLCISIERSEVLISYKGIYYVRVGSTNQRMIDGQIRTRVLQTMNKLWDELPSPWRIEAVSKELVERFLKLAGESGRLNLMNKTDVQSVLHNLNLIQDDRLTNAAVLLFTHEPQRLFHEARIQIARFDNRGNIGNPQVISGSLWEQIDGAMKILEIMLNVHIQIEVTESSLEGMQRQEQWIYPREAIREALLNTVTHRNYLISSPIEIRVYDDYLLFSSPGNLPEPLTIDDLYRRVHRSVRRNPQIAEVFYLARLIERWGTGTMRILDLFTNKGLPQPKFEEISGSMWTTFYQDIFTPDKLKSQGLSERQIKAVLRTKENGRITNSEYRELTELSDEAALQDINDLIEKNIFERQGRGRGTHYVLVS
jgi:ATP-dependent DNA helicase RecG